MLFVSCTSEPIDKSEQFSINIKDKETLFFSNDLCSIDSLITNSIAVHNLVVPRGVKTFNGYANRDSNGHKLSEIWVSLSLSYPDNIDKLTSHSLSFMLKNTEFEGQSKYANLRIQVRTGGILYAPRVQINGVGHFPYNQNINFETDILDRDLSIIEDCEGRDYFSIDISMKGWLHTYPSSNTIDSIYIEDTCLRAILAYDN